MTWRWPQMEDNLQRKMTSNYEKWNERNTQRKSRVWLCSAQLDYSFKYPCFFKVHFVVIIIKFHKWGKPNWNSVFVWSNFHRQFVTLNMESLFHLQPIVKYSVKNGWGISMQICLDDIWMTWTMTNTSAIFQMYFKWCLQFGQWVK